MTKPMRKRNSISIPTEIGYQEALEELERLMPLDPLPESDVGQRMLQLADALESFETACFGSPQEAPHA